MEKPTGKQMIAGGGTLAAIAAVAIGWQQIGEVFVLHESHDLIHASQNVATQIQIIDVQIIQAQTQLDLILDRMARGRAQQGDAQRVDRLNARIKRLEEAREKLLIK